MWTPFTLTVDLTVDAAVFWNRNCSSEVKSCDDAFRHRTFHITEASNDESALEQSTRMIIFVIFRGCA